MAKKSQLESLSAQDQATYIKAIKLGLFPSVAARLIGKAPKTVARWIYEGENGNETYRDFAFAMRQAEAEGFHDYMSSFIDLVSNDGVEPRDRIKGYTWLFERRYGMTASKAESEEGQEDKFKTHTLVVKGPPSRSGDG